MLYTEQDDALFVTQFKNVGVEVFLNCIILLIYVKMIMLYGDDMTKKTLKCKIFDIFL